MGIGQMDVPEQLADNRFEVETKALGLVQIPHFDTGQDSGSHQVNVDVLSIAHL